MMKRNYLFAILAIAFIAILATNALALRYESNTFKYGTINADGSFTQTQTPINNISIMGFVCTSVNCATIDSNAIISGTLFDGQVHTSKGDSINLTYPTKLQSSYGYGVIFYKKGYIPYEVTANYYGTDSNDPVGPFTDYLSKKAVCNTPISDLKATTNSGSTTATFNIDSPITSSGSVNYNPQSLDDYYSTNVNVTLNVTSANSTTSQVKSIEVPFSGPGAVSLNFISQPGTYNISVSAQANDLKCLSSIKSKTSINYVVNPELNNNSKILIKINNPQEGKTYNSQLVPLNITAINATNVVYSINGGLNKTYTSPTTLTLQNGTNTLNVYASNSHNNATKSVTFNVNATAIIKQPISLKINNPQENKTYNTNKIFLNITALNATNIFYSINNGSRENYTSPTTLTLQNGNTTIKAFASNPSGTNAIDSVSFVVNGTNDITPPGSVIGLSLIDSSSTSLTWAWGNPADPDFNKAIIYIDGVNVFNTSSSSYQAVGLNSDSTHTITIYTMDNSENINNNAVSDTETTKSGYSDGGSSTTTANGYNFINLSSELPPVKTIHSQLNDQPSQINQPINSNGNDNSTMGWALFALIIACIILLIILLLMWILRALKA